MTTLIMNTAIAFYLVAHIALIHVTGMRVKSYGGGVVHPGQIAVKQGVAATPAIVSSLLFMERLPHSFTPGFKCTRGINPNDLSWFIVD